MLIVAVEYDDICADVYFNPFNEAIDQDLYNILSSIILIISIFLLVHAVWFST